MNVKEIELCIIQGFRLTEYQVLNNGGIVET